MPSARSGIGRSAVDAACDRIFRRVVSLPRDIVGGVSRAMSQGMDLIGSPRQHLPPSPSFPLPPPTPADPLVVGLNLEEEKLAFLNEFERQYGSSHPFFYACSFTDTLKMAAEEGKLVFVYLHSPQHPFTAAFCRDTLSSEVVVQFLDANFVSWAEIENRGEWWQVAATLSPGSFPFCAVVAPAAGDIIAVLQQIEGPVSPSEMMEILQGTVEEQGEAFGSSSAREEDRRSAERCQLQEEQDAAYFAALKIDKEKERVKTMPSAETSSQTSVEIPILFKQSPAKQESTELKQVTTTSTRKAQSKETVKKGKGPKDTQILIRFPNGERREQSFSCKDKIRSIYEYIDSLELPSVGDYNLISTFPRRVFGMDQLGMTLKEAGLHPSASLFLELL